MLLEESVGGGWKEASVFVLRPLVLLLLFIPCRSLVVMVEADGILTKKKTAAAAGPNK